MAIEGSGAGVPALASNNSGLGRLHHAGGLRFNRIITIVHPRAGHPPLFPALLQRRHINHKAVLDVPFQQTLVGLVDLLNFDQFDIGGEAVIGAEIEHLLSFPNPADAEPARL